MVMILLIALPVLCAALLPLAYRAAGDRASWLALAAPLAGLALLAGVGAGVLGGHVLVWRRPWLESAGLNLSLRLDGLGFAFALLVLGIGLLVCLYARYYLPRSRSTIRFFTLLLLFMGAMLGVVLSENLLQLLVFWEMTSLVSFLLIGFWSYRADARKGARMALTVTGGGGLALLAGVLLLGHIAGSFELSAVLAQAGAVQKHPLYPAVLVLVLLAAFTKSAQFPFHFWLPHAMAAPTPVSSYLHSATMVKAGVFLLARLYPVLDGTGLWFYLVSMTGLATLVVGAAMALLQEDLKGLLAYSTISHLGLITLLFGLDTQLSTVAALFHIFNHAVFKASLFMAAGIIDHETGTRDLNRLRGLRHYMPHTALLASVASLSMAGVPLLNGFLSKEMFFGETLAQELLGSFNWVIPALATLAGALTVCYSLRFIYGVFFDGRPRPEDLPHYPPHEPSPYMKIPVEVLVVICLVVGLEPSLSVGALLAAASVATLGGPPPAYSLSLWHGFNLPLLMSAVSMAAGSVLFFRRRGVFHRYFVSLQPWNARDRFEAAVAWAEGTARAITRALENGSVQRYLACLAAAMVLLPAWAWWQGAAGSAPLAGPLAAGPLDGATAAGMALLALGALGVVASHRHRLTALILLSACGLLVALAFTRFSAPDLALTQLSVEVVTVLLLVLALYFMPRSTLAVDAAPAPGPGRRLRDIAIALAAGGALGGAAYAVLTRPYQSIGDFFLANAVEGGGGHNVVNVILVDFRGFDTLGEVCVLVVTALAVQALLKGMRLPAPGLGPNGFPWSRQGHPLLLSILARLMLPLTLMVAVFILLRGHNLPGGGFIAALVTAVALLLQYVANGVLWTEARITLDYRALAGAGVALAGLAGAGSWAFGAPFLTAAFGHFHLPLLGEIELATAMIFDLGVYLAVIGVTLLILSHLGVKHREMQPERQEQQEEPGLQVQEENA